MSINIEKTGSKVLEGETKSHEVESIPQEKSSNITEVTDDLLEAAVNEQKFKDIFETQKNFAPDQEVALYHGLNGGYEKATDVLNSEHRGIEERSGPTLSLTPLAQFWKSGDLGLKYSIPRRLVQFPGEENPDAIVSVSADNVARIHTKDGTLPFTEVKGEVLRAKGTKLDSTQESQIVDTLKQLDTIRTNGRFINGEMATESKKHIEELLQKAQSVYLDITTTHRRDGIHDNNALPLGEWGIARNLLSLLNVSGKQLEGKAVFGSEVGVVTERINDFIQKLKEKVTFLETSRGKLEAEQTELQTALTSTNERSMLSWKVGLLNKQFFNGLKEKFPDKSSFLGKVLDESTRQKNPKAFLESQVNARISAIKSEVAFIDADAKRYQDELDVYTELASEITNATKTIQQALEVAKNKIPKK